jgi:hypothetical protein
MRTTLDIADDVLFAAKEKARQEGASVGAVLSRLARQSLLAPQAAAGTTTVDQSDLQARWAKLGIQPLPFRPGVVVTDELVNRIRDEEGI